MRLKRILTSCVLILIAGYLLNFSLVLQELTRNGNAPAMVENGERISGKEETKATPTTSRIDEVYKSLNSLSSPAYKAILQIITIPLALLALLVGLKLIRQAGQRGL